MTRFEAWLKIAEPGDIFVYHTGASLHGCRHSTIREVRRSYNSGQITLTQKRISHGFGAFCDGSEFEYQARRLEHPGKVWFPFPINDPHPMVA